MKSLNVICDCKVEHVQLLSFLNDKSSIEFFETILLKTVDIRKTPFLNNFEQK